MKVYKEETVTKTNRFLDKTICDLCGKEGGYTWATSDFEVLETEIRLKEGEQYPEGGWGTKIVVDICPGCFKTKLIPWLESQGVKVEEKKWGW